MRLAIEAGSDTAAAAEKLGIKGVPIDGGALLEKGVAATLQPLLEKGFSPCQVGAFFMNALSPDAAAKTESIARVKRLIPLAAEAGCPWIAFAAGSCQPDTFGGADPRNLTSAALDEAAHTLEPLARLAEQHQVKLTLEPHIRSVIATPERAAALCGKVGSPALRVTFDVSNFYDFMDLLDPTEMIERCGKALRPWCGLVHLKEVAVTDGFHLHAGLVPMGKGRTDWTQVLTEAVAGFPNDSWVLVEHCSGLDEAVSSVTLVRAAAKAAGLSLS